MDDLDSWFEKLDEVWPIKRGQSEKAAEKQALASAIETQLDFDSLFNKAEIEVADKPIKRLPSLINLIQSFSKKSVIIPVIQNTVVAQEIVEKKDEVELAFEEIFENWPENDIVQNKQKAKVAFIAVARTTPLEDLVSACNRYIEEQNDVTRATVRVLGMKRFVSDDDILETWIGKAQAAKSLQGYDRSYFNEAYAAYPNFTNKDQVRIQDDSLQFYKRWVKEDQAFDFYCAVLAFKDERKEENYKNRDNEGYDEKDGIKYTKNFCNFIKVWATQPGIWEYQASYTSDLIYKAYEARDILPLRYVYEGDMRLSCISYLCQERNKVDVPSIQVCITQFIEKVSYYLKIGVNGYNKKLDLPPDYSIVSEIMEKLKDIAKGKNKPTVVYFTKWDPETDDIDDM